MIFIILSMVKTGYKWDIMILYFLVGGFSPPLWKYESVGMMTFPIHGNKKTCSKPPTRYYQWLKRAINEIILSINGVLVNTYNWYNSGHNCGFFLMGFSPIWWWVSRWESRITCRMRPNGAGFCWPTKQRVILEFQNVGIQKFQHHGEQIWAISD